MDSACSRFPGGLEEAAVGRATGRIGFSSAVPQVWPELAYVAGVRTLWLAVCVTLLSAVALSSSSAVVAAAPEIAETYQLRRCPGKVKVGRTRSSFARYRRLSCVRAREIVRIVEAVNGPYPDGYAWSTWHGATPPPRVFDGWLLSTYYAPDGGRAPHRGDPRVAVVLFGPLPDAWRD